MKLDSKEQQQLLLQIVSTTGVRGSYEQAKEAVQLIDELIEDIKKAEILVN